MLITFNPAVGPSLGDPRMKNAVHCEMELCVGLLLYKNRGI
jgi:hypothetical protein